MKTKSLIGLLLYGIFASGCGGRENGIVQDNIDHAARQLSLQLEASMTADTLLNPKTVDPSGATAYITPREWTSGFFPGQLWLMYELTGDTCWQNAARRYTETLHDIQFVTHDHDVGFMIGCSYGNGYRLRGAEADSEVIVQAARSLSTRFNPVVGAIQSWDVKGWIVPKGWKFPVIIDNMMNLEILFRASELTGDPAFRRIAVRHAETTLVNHFRRDYSTYHVVDYDPATGRVLHKHTAQGFAHESLWSRGQAWAVYGYTMAYRHTHDKKYLDLARKAASVLLNHPRLAPDMIPYWDMDAVGMQESTRDVSSACILASALYELSLYGGEKYKTAADKIIRSLSKPPYRAEPGSNNFFILKHSVGSIPHGKEIDVPINYADYYFLEALVRKRSIETAKKHTNPASEVYANKTPSGGMAFIQPWVKE